MTQDPIARWEQRWQERNTPWDLGEPHPGLYTLWKRLEPVQRTGTWWVPGCGQGHEAAFVVRKGLKVVGEDFSPAAIEVAKETYGHLARFQTGDVLEQKDAGAYHGIVDRAMWCALRQELWRDYLKSCHYRLRPGGVLISFAFASLKDVEEGPPFAATEGQVRELLAETGFDLTFIEKRPWNREKLAAVEEEWWIIARKPKQSAVEGSTADRS